MFSLSRHPERRFLQFHRKNRSRRTPRELAALTPLDHFSHKFVLPQSLRSDPSMSIHPSRGERTSAGPQPERSAHSLCSYFSCCHPVGICCCFLLLHLFFAFSAQKSHVKSQNHLTPSNKTRSSLKFSYPQTAIIKTVEKNKQAPDTLRG